MKGLTILLVVDNPLTQRLVRATLEGEGVELLDAPNAGRALELLAEHRPDLVLQDLVLPDLSGFELVQRLRAHPSLAGVPILAFTGLLSKDDEARISAAGFDGFVTKPIEPSRLLNIVRGHLPSREVLRRPFGAGKLLLVVDDDPLQRKLARFRLGRLGFRIETASDGAEAIEAAHRSRPDVIVTDALMPRLDGFGLCLAIRGAPTLADVPIILVTSSYVEPADQELARRAGANAFVVRTADLADVIGALERIVGDKAPAAPPPRAVEVHGEVDTARTVRALHQLERQVSVNAGLMQRCSTLAAELSVLSTVADALVNTRDVESALFDILASCLDVAGAARGAIYVREPDGTHALRAQHGFSRAEAELESFFGHPELLKRVEETGAMLDVTTAFSPHLGPGALLVPLTAGGEVLGTLVLDAPTGGAESEDWKAFAQAIGSQVSLALALAKAFARVASSEQRSRALMENAEDAIFVGNETGAVLEVNHAGERLLGLPTAEIVGRRFTELIVGSDGGPEKRAARANGTMVPIELSTAHVNAGGEMLFIAIVRDVSERIALSEQLRQVQKMDAIGRLAGGVAHDFNNILSVVISYSELILRELPANDPLAADVKEIKKAGERAADLTRQLLAFGRQQVITPRVMVLSDIVTTMERMISRLIGEDIDLVVALASGLGKVRADAGQMHQVLLNLVVNARDAMPRGGKLSIETANVEVDAETARRCPGLAPGHHVSLTVTDTGVGMEKATMARIFEPFFTTKDVNRGTGLGLSTVFGIVQQSGGFIWVESEIGRGSMFKIYLPRTDAAAEDRATPIPSGGVRRGSETILLVEDEDQVRVLIRGILRRAGYRVLDAQNGGEAVLICEQHDGTIDLLLSDIVMPRLGGRQLAERLRPLRPAMKVLLMSGYTDDAVARYDAMATDLPFLQKPITPEVLVRKVREVLDAVTSSEEAPDHQ